MLADLEKSVAKKDNITAILDSYNSFRNVASKLKLSRLEQLEQTHMKNFSLTWSELMDRMYQRYIYKNLRCIVWESLISLKDYLDTKDYVTVAQKLIQFDQTMELINYGWAEKWDLLQRYHTSSEDIIRRDLMLKTQVKLKEIKENQFDLGPYKELLNRKFATGGCPWTEVDTMDEAWALTVNYLKQTFEETSDALLHLKVHNEKCKSCGIESEIHYTYAYLIIHLLFELNIDQ